jgi:WD40 repeat protein
VAVGYWSGEVVLWRPVGDGAPKGVVLGTNGERVNDLAFDPDGTVLASGDSGGTIELWRVAKRGPPTRLEGHEGEVTSLAFAPDGEMLASGGDDGTVRLWDPQEGRSLGDPLRLGRPVSAVAFSPDGRWLIAVHGAHGGLTVWDARLWQVGKDTLDRVRQRFCAAVASDVAPSRGAVCQRHG